ncbi:MAG: hypothetical protein QG641_2119 [Candidatus Poribacteria bacterium]|nr:hypothetical protein [Candidatus Poribacteria bacterium]MDQ1328833.1 hypothetical protein [Candidatus Poribacteria bacterium]
MEKIYTWYDVIDSNENLMQGDFIYGCPVIIPPPNVNMDEISVDVMLYNVIVMSQSCDLVNKKIDLILVCPFWSLKDFSEKDGKDNFYKSSKGKEALRRGDSPGYHLLNKCDIEGFKTEDYLIVDFHNVYGVHYDLLINIVQKQTKRIRLLPPYREHLSQAFARFFMRIGLPVDIPPFR